MTGILGALATEVVDWALILVVFACYHACTSRTVGAATPEGAGPNEGTREHLHMLRQSRWRETYAAVIAAWLDPLDRLWTKELRADPPPFPAHSPRAAFSHGLLKFSLAFAFACPILGPFLHWLATGEAQVVAGVQVIPAAEAWWERPAIIGGLASLAFAMIAAGTAERKGAHLRSQLFVAIGLAIGMGAFANSMSVVVIAVGLAFVSAFPAAGARASATAFAVAISVGMAILAAGLRTSTILFLTGLGIGLGGAIAIHWIGRRIARPAVMEFLWALAGMAAIIAAVAWAAEIRAKGVAFIVFLGLIPLLNGIANFLSIGMTRLLLRRAERAQALRARMLLWLLDLLFALLALVLLIGGFIAIVTLVRPENGAPLVDVFALIEDVRMRPEAHYWLGFMVFTTLLPSAIHMVAAAYSAFLLVLPAWRARIAADLEAGAAGNGHRGNRGRIWLVLLLTVARGGPTAALWSLLSFLWSERVGLRAWSLDQAEGFARWLEGFV